MPTDNLSPEMRARTDEVARKLAALNSLHRETSHLALDLAMEFMEIFMRAPAEDMPEIEGELGVNLGPCFDELERSHNVKIDEVARNHIAAELMLKLNFFGGVSRCMIWDIAHSLEHALSPDTDDDSIHMA
jgi:hypothetical protein